MSISAQTGFQSLNSTRNSSIAAENASLSNSPPAATSPLPSSSQSRASSLFQSLYSPKDLFSAPQSSSLVRMQSAPPIHIANGGDLKASNLENDFLGEICIHVSLKPHPFGDFLQPNEMFPQYVKPHLALMDDGLIVSTGTERSFFDLSLSDENKCTGLVIRDINPRVKAYTDFLILLLRISKSRKEFIDLSELNGSKKETLKLIKSRIVFSNMPQILKEYYLINLEDFSSLYWDEQKRGFAFSDKDTEFDYWDKDEPFEKLRRYAQKGKIISTIGDINDLNFLANHKIAIVDTSNIAGYTPLH